MLVSKDFKFDAAHHLTKYNGKCENPHGHTYRLRVTLEGKLNDDDMVMDFVALKKLVNDKVLSKYDHADLNDFFENPTAELIAMEIWKMLDGASEFGSAKLYEVVVWETEGSFVTYRGE